MCSNELPRLGREAIDALADRIALAAAHIDAASYQLLSDIHQFNTHAGWAAQGAKSCAHWLSWRIGVGLVAAREQVRVARALSELPLIAAAMERGELSYSKVRAITRVAESSNEQLLLDMARGATGAQLDRLCGKFRSLDRRPSWHAERRFVSRRHMPDGTVRIELRLQPDEAERFWSALQAIRRDLEPSADAPAEAPPAMTAGLEPSTDALAEAPPAMTAGLEPSTDAPAEAPSAMTADLEPSTDAPAEAHSARPADLADAAMAMVDRAVDWTRAHLVRETKRAQPAELFVHLREERLAGSEIGWQAELHDGTTLEGETLLRLACDCGLVVAKTDARGAVLDIGRRTRKVPTALMRALLLRDRGCRFPGCAAKAFVAAHHIEHWAHGGATSLENTILLCHRCHLAVHEGGFRVERGADGEYGFFDPAGRQIPFAPVPPPVFGEGAALVADGVRARGLILHPETALPNWNGHGLDLHAAVGALASREHESRSRAALGRV
jgi:hypothetical protein